MKRFLIISFLVGCGGPPFTLAPDDAGSDVLDPISVDADPDVLNSPPKKPQATVDSGTIPDSSKDSGTMNHHDSGTLMVPPDAGTLPDIAMILDSGPDVYMQPLPDSSTDPDLPAPFQCQPGSTQCVGTSSQLCGPDGQWETVKTCPFVCSGAGSCTGSCVPGVSQCSGLQSQTCDNTGNWQTSQTCPFICSGSGSCTGSCVPNTTQCQGTSPQICSSSGNWESQSACAQPTPDCSAGSCTCSGTTCGNSCVNIQTDLNNCGACGSVCNGACSQGHCITVLSKGGSPNYVTVDSANVYWTDSNGSVLSAPKEGGTIQTIASSQNTPFAILDNGTNVYWTNQGSDGNGSVMDLTLGNNTISTIASSQNPEHLAADSTYVYWAAGPSIMAFPLSGGSPIAIASNQTDAIGITVDSMNVYWTDPGAGSVMKMDKSSGEITSVSTGGRTPLGIAVSANNIYWTDTMNSAVMVAPIGGGTPTIFASNQASPYSIALDSANVYWVAGSSIMKESISGGTPVPLVSGQVSTQGLAIDSNSLYWTDPGAGKVMRISPR